MEMTDHDLLIRLDQKVGDLQCSVKDLTDGTVAKIIVLEKDKADRVELDALQKKLDDNVEVRLRVLEGKIIWVFAFATGAGVIVSLLSNWFLK